MTALDEAGLPTRAEYEGHGYFTVAGGEQAMTGLLALAKPPTAVFAASDEMGFGAAWRAHHALDWTLQGLKKHPGLGGDLLLVALQSPVTRNRNMAIQALTAWPNPTWPEGAGGRLERVATTDPNANTREAAHELVAGRSLT